LSVGKRCGGEEASDYDRVSEHATALTTAWFRALSCAFMETRERGRVIADALRYAHLFRGATVKFAG
jgi:hypothetical protein